LMKALVNLRVKKPISSSRRGANAKEMLNPPRLSHARRSEPKGLVGGTKISVKRATSEDGEETQARHHERSAEIARLERRIGHRFRDPAHLETALTHPSYAHLKHIESYQRLEFLGDAVLNACVAIFVFAKYPDKDEAFLTDLKAGYVNRHFLQEVGERLDLGNLMKGVGLSEYRLDQAVESLIGAIFLDGGFKPAEAFIKKFILNRRIKPLHDPKNLLKSLASKTYHRKISFSLLKESGPAHKKTFYVEARVEGSSLTGHGEGATKKEAESKAAENLLEKLHSHESARESGIIPDAEKDVR